MGYGNECFMHGPCWVGGVAHLTPHALLWLISSVALTHLSMQMLKAIVLRGSGRVVVQGILVQDAPDESVGDPSWPPARELIMRTFALRVCSAGLW